MEEKDELKQPLQRHDTARMPVYDNQTPIGTYYGEQGNTQADVMQQMIADYVSRTDPRMQAEQDAKMQRGRQFWTGANLFANVVANAINANGTAKGAPNMTWNDNASQKMYDTWQNADKELKADRRAAQQRYEQLMMQDAAWRAAGAEKRAAEEKGIADKNFNIKLEQAIYKRNKADKDVALEKQYAREDQIRRENQDFQREGWERADRRARMGSRGGGGKRASTSSPTEYSIPLGSIDISAKDKKEADRIQRDVANKIVERYNKDIEARNKERGVTDKKEDLIPKPKNAKEAEAIIYQLGDMYDNGDYDDFRKEINQMYGIDDIYAEENNGTPEFEQFGGHSVRPDESSLPNPRMYSGSTQQNPRAYQGKPVTWNTPAKHNKKEKEDPNDFFKN